MALANKTGEIRFLASRLKDYLEYMADLGVESLPAVQPDIPEILTGPAEHTPVRKDETLEDIRADLGDCQRCPLCRTRKTIVFGEGREEARLMFIGEGPGKDEDLTGRPFVGPAGQLLTDIIVKGIRIKREDCYIANIVKCRPPGNRDPLPQEAGTCLPFLKRQIFRIQPTVIVALGRIATNYLLGTDLPLTRLRHRFHDFSGIPVMPTFHPAALLRAPERKKETWDDIKMVIARLTQE